jgi:hypothetical protein
MQRMRMAVAALVVVTLGACKKPAGTVVADWTYEGDDAARTPPRRLAPPKIVTSDAEWSTSKGTAKLKFETEIGDLAGADGVHWNWPRHILITLAEPSSVKLPSVDCMPGPPGNKVANGVLVHPLGKDGVTPTGLVACFASSSDGTPFVYDVNGDGNVTRNVPTSGP